MIQALLLDIEGTVCSISFVKDVLYPYFMEKVPEFLGQLQFPLTSQPEVSDLNKVNNIVLRFPKTDNFEQVLRHITHLVDSDIKDPVLKAFQGFVWQLGYENGDLVAPIYEDALEIIQKFAEAGKVYIYSSGSVKAQKLLFGHVRDGEKSKDINDLLSGYFDITTSGFKQDPASYTSILRAIGLHDKPAEVLFLSDNVNEVKAAVTAGLKSTIVDRPGNAPVSDTDKQKYGIVANFRQLQLFS